MQLGLAAWHRAILAGCPEDQLIELVAADAMFHSPVARTAVEGRDAVVLYLSAAGKVFASSGLRYVRELVEGPEACLEFEAVLDEVPLNGVQLIRFDLEGRIADFKLMVRPLDAGEALWRKMAEALEDT